MKATIPNSLGTAQWKCNKCGEILVRALGWKNWTKSFCKKTGKESRIYRISTPSK